MLPAGDQKIGALDYMVETNASPLAVSHFNSLPIKTTGGATIVSQRRGPCAPRVAAADQRGAGARQAGRADRGAEERQCLDSGRGAGRESQAARHIAQTLPPGVSITPLADASAFVRDSVSEVVQEMVTAAVLTGLTVLLFLGSWRSTLIVVTSIPLAILTSVLMLSWFGQTINVMTLGGLALAVGILVDDATVVIENIDAHLEHGAELEPGIIDAANEIVIPTFVSTLCICIVWLPLFQLSRRRPAICSCRWPRL